MMFGVPQITRWIAAIIAVVLLAPAASATKTSEHVDPRRLPQRFALNAHVHSAATLQGPVLVRLAQQHGKIEAGLDALGLSRFNLPHAVQLATTMLSLTSHYDHHATFGQINRFVAAAFPGQLYAHWVARASAALRGEARRSLIVQDPHETELLIRTAHQGRVDLSGIGLLVSDRRPTRRDPAQTKRVLRRFPEVLGSNNHGPEDDPTLATFHATIDTLLTTRPRGSIFVVHTGERDRGHGGEHSVNRHLDDLLLRSRQDDLTSIHFILAHGTLIADIQRAAEALGKLTRKGIRVSINPLPPSNLAFGAVDSIAEIDAFRIGSEDIFVGTDNIGSLALNHAVVGAMLRGDLITANNLVSPLIQSRDGWSSNGQHQISRPDHGNGKRYQPNGTGSKTDRQATATAP